MTARNNRGRRYSPSCCGDYKRMTIVAAMFTMLFCSICVGLLVNDLVDVSRYLDSWLYEGYDDQVVSNQTDAAQKLDKEEEVFSATISKVMYTALICDLVLLLISSVGLLKGVYQKKQSLIMNWILIVFATIIYAGAVIARDFSLEGGTNHVYGNSVVYVIFVITEVGFSKHVILAFKEVRQATILRHRQPDVATFDPRYPDTAIFNIAGTVAQPGPEIVFKLPSYDEAVTENEGEGAHPVQLGKPPPYESSLA